MKNQINLSVSLIRRIVAAVPAANNGMMDIDLGNFGMASIMLDQLQIGDNVLILPLRFRLRRNSDRNPLEADMELTNWRISEDTIWFTLERIGNLRGPILEVARRGLIAVISRIVTLRTGTQIRSGRRAGELGIPLVPLLGRWGTKELPVTISAIQMKNGVTLYLAER
ncbi:MAG: hypothetical protein JSU61_03295 [Fidelibacterota bacterium]|nr:MAG: hypothetical protein JSU61_03295 [Candidatus Neomarinimicrobiota bacterium]